MAEQEPVRAIGYLRTDNQVLVNGDIFRVLQELIARQVADHSAIEALQRKVN